MTPTALPIHADRSPLPVNPGIFWDAAPLASGYSLINISGDLKPGWLGRISAYLSRERINIVRGGGRKSGPLCWDASFEIEGSYRSTDPHSRFNPLTALVGKTELAELPSLRISDFLLESSTRHGGSMYVEVSGRDCLGFLYGILRIFSFYSLFPTEFEISTSSKTVFDRFWLKGIGGSTPAEDEMKSLHERLSRMLADNTLG